MNRLRVKSANQASRKRRIRSRVQGTNQRPRMSVFISARHVAVQLIDDTTGKTLLSASTIGVKTAKSDKQTMTEKAAAVGAEIAKAAKGKKIKRVVLDRNGRLYHGRVKALADAARKEGLEF